MHQKLHVLGASGASIAAVAVAGALLVPTMQAEKPPTAFSAPDEVPNWDHSVETPTKQVPKAAPVKVPVKVITYSAPIHEEKAPKKQGNKHRKPKHHHHHLFKVKKKVKVKIKVVTPKAPKVPEVPKARPLRVRALVSLSVNPEDTQ
jgi:hypothetical protein